MTPIFSPAAAELLEQYQRDVPVRWAPEDLVAQREFVNTHLAGRDWLDWSTASAALELFQAVHAQTSFHTPGRYDALVLAGPIVELLEPTTVFGRAASVLAPAGKLVGIVPCLRDNSPESRAFAELAGATLWPYYTAEELQEMLRETGWKMAMESGGFVAIPQFARAVVE